jgi:2-dehydro-3-deoxyphosphogluconate aldolase/(4S)-4-hydroxy-2-oxoglutarate aldolase
MKLDIFLRSGLVPVIRAGSRDEGASLCKALVDGGIRALEVTMTVPDAPGLLAALRQELPDSISIGAGTVTNLQQLTACLDAGADFIVTPICAVELVAPCHQREVPIALGAATPTEIFRAHEGGADLVKVFPISALGGPEYLRALRGPFPKIPLMPTGGIALDNLAQYVKAGARLLGVGGALADNALLKREGEAAVSALARRYVEAYVSALQNAG